MSAEPMTLAEAEGIARYLAEHAPPIGDGSIADRQTQVVVTLLTALDEARAALARRDATIAAVRAAIEREWDRGNIAVAPIAAALSAPVEAGATEPTRDGDSDEVECARCAYRVVPGCPDCRPVEAGGPATVNAELGVAVEAGARHLVNAAAPAMHKLFRRVSARQLGADDAVDMLLGWPNLAEAGAPAEPGYQRIADAIEAACDTAALALDARRDGVPVEEPYLRVARVLDKAGLIDWSAFAGAPAEQTSDTAREDQP